MSGTTPTGGQDEERPDDPYAAPGSPLPPPDQPWSQEQSVASPYAQAQPTRPRPITTAVRLMYLGASLSALAGLIAFLGRDALQEVAEEANRQSVNPLTQEQLETGISGLVGTYVIVAIASFLLWIWMASANGAGKSWARTTSVVLTVLGFVYAAVAAIFFGTTALNLLVFLATIVVSIVILVLLYRPESSQYYAAQSRRI